MAARTLDEPGNSRLLVAVQPVVDRVEITGTEESVARHLMGTGSVRDLQECCSTLSELGTALAATNGHELGPLLAGQVKGAAMHGNLLTGHTIHVVAEYRITGLANESSSLRRYGVNGVSLLRPYDTVKK